MSGQRYPLAWPHGWPRARNRTRAKFGKAESVYRDGVHAYISKKDLSVADGTRRAIRELEKLGANGEAIISTNLVLRLDGYPRSDQRAPDDPGVAVYWTDRAGLPKVMAIDRYDRVADNLAAIAATLEAMRAIERHGGGQILERAFTGFDALPAPRKPWEVLGIGPKANAEQINFVFRNLAKEHHPDKHGGDDSEMKKITEAREMMLKAKGWES